MDLEAEVFLAPSLRVHPHGGDNIQITAGVGLLLLVVEQEPEVRAIVGATVGVYLLLLDERNLDQEPLPPLRGHPGRRGEMLKSRVNTQG